MLPAQAMLPAQQYMATQNVLQALPHVVSSANTQTYQLVPSQGTADNTKSSCFSLHFGLESDAQQEYIIGVVSCQAGCR